MKQRTRWIFQVMAVLALTLTVLPVRYAMAQTMSEKQDLVDTATAAGDFTTLVQALEAAGLTDTLKGDDTYTVFAPTDEAFAALPEGALDELLADPEALKSVLLYHVVPGRLIAALINDGGEATTAQGEPVKFTFADGKKLVNDANITAKDIQAGNGVIHVIDKVLLPPSMGGATGPAAATEATPEAAAEATATASDALLPKPATATEHRHP
ncbi:MAG: fasciclin domain-containing protein [Anaerolineales bacterium]|nr:fasciclin domain-containing protein [Anaerolineales bacterium]